MYVSHPYNSSHVEKAKAALNQYSLDEVSEALKENLEVLKNVIKETHFKTFELQESLLSFIDDLAQKEYILGGEKLGNLISNEIDKIYKPDQLVLEADLKAFRELDSINGDLQEALYDTVVTDDEDQIKDDIDATGAFTQREQEIIDRIGPEIIERYLTYKASEKLINKDEGSKTLEKAVLMTMISDFTRVQKLKSPANVQRKNLNNNWNYVAESITGAHTLGINSDVYQMGKNGLLAVLADGVTYAPTIEEHEMLRLRNYDVSSFKEPEYTLLRTFSGHNLAKQISENLSEFNFSSLQDIELKETPEISEEASKFAAGIKANLYSIAAHRSKINLNYEYRNHKKDFLAATTIDYAFEMGNKLVTVQMGDSDIACYDKDGNKVEAQETVAVSNKHGESTKLFSVSFYYEEDYGHHEAEDSEPREYSIKIYDKDAVDKVAMISDGASVYAEDNENLPEELNGSLEDNLSEVLSKAHIKKGTLDHDDKTAIFLQKAS